MNLRLSDSEAEILTIVLQAEFHKNKFSRPSLAVQFFNILDKLQDGRQERDISGESGEAGSGIAFRHILRNAGSRKTGIAEGENALTDFSETEEEEENFNAKYSRIAREIREELNR
jgi:hypothetical protein